MSRNAFCAVVLLLVAAVTGCQKEDARMRGEPRAQELDAVVSGAGRLRLGMLEKDALNALEEPSRRQEPASPGDGTTLVWEHLRGPQPGGVMARFQFGKLVYLEIVPATRSLPRIARAAATALERAEVVQRAVAKQLRMSDVESVTGKRGQQIRMTIGRGYEDQPDRVVVARTLAWEVEPGGQALLVEERDGNAGQPIVRKLQ